LKYTFPQKYLSPINDAFSGLYNRAKIVFRIGKKETDLNTEEIINNANRSIQNNIQPKDIEMNPIINNRINDINPQNFNNRNNNNYSIPNDRNEFQDNSVNYPKLDNQKNKGYEVNLD